MKHRSIEFTKTFSPVAGKLIAIRIDWRERGKKRIKFIPETDYRYARSMASKTTFGGFIKR
jgi:hypothetical protein